MKKVCDSSNSECRANTYTTLLDYRMPGALYTTMKQTVHRITIKHRKEKIDQAWSHLSRTGLMPTQWITKASQWCPIVHQTGELILKHSSLCVTLLSYLHMPHILSIDWCQLPWWGVCVAQVDTLQHHLCLHAASFSDMFNHHLTRSASSGLCEYFIWPAIDNLIEASLSSIQVNALSRGEKNCTFSHSHHSQ